MHVNKGYIKRENSMQNNSIVDIYYTYQLSIYLSHIYLFQIFIFLLHVYQLC